MGQTVGTERLQESSSRGAYRTWCGRIAGTDGGPERPRPADAAGARRQPGHSLAAARRQAAGGPAELGLGRVSNSALIDVDYHRLEPCMR